MATVVLQPPPPTPRPSFVVGRPRPDVPLTGYPGFVGRAKTTIGTKTAEATKEDTFWRGNSDSTPVPPANAAFAALTRIRHNVTGWPRIVVRDVSGRTLDTFTTLQDAIYRASWTMKTLHEWPVTPMQWRLPKAPVPSRPDYSRAGPRGPTSYSLDLTRSYRNDVHSAPVVSRHPVVEIDVDDVSFVAESLRLLPELPSFAFLRHSLLAGERTYLRIVGSLLLHQRHLADLGSHGAELSIPGFGAGCKRAGFCYGCDKNPLPHIHQDVPMWMGGGFRFYRPDRPLNPHLHKDPRTWVTGDAETDLRYIVDKTGGMAAFQRAAAASQSLVASDNVTSFLPFLPGFSRVRMLVDPAHRQPNALYEDWFYREREGEGIAEEEVGGEKAAREEGEGEEEESEEEEGGSQRTREDQLSPSQRRHVVIATAVPRKRTGRLQDSEEEEEEEVAAAVTTEKGRRVTSLKKGGGGEADDSGRDTEYDSGVDGGVGSGSTRTTVVGRERAPTWDRGRKSALTSSRPSTLTSPDRTAMTSGSRSRSESRSPARSGVAFGGSVKSGRSLVESSGSREKEETAEEKASRLEKIPFAKKREEKLYRAPVAFKPLKKNRRITVARDPFSSDRELDVPKGGTFELKKGDRKVTTFVNIKRGDTGYKPPPKFELKDNERKATQFWAPKPKKNNEGKGRRRGQGQDDDEASRRRRRQAESDDSGLDLHSASTRDNDNRDTTNEDDGINKEPEKPPEPEPEAEVKKKRQEVVKKERRVISPPGAKRKPRTPSPPPPPRVPTPEPPLPPSPPPPPTPSPAEEPPLPDFDLPEVPDLPEWKEKERAERQKKQKFVVAPPAPGPVLQEAPRRRRPAPRVRRALKVPVHRLKTRPAEAPVGAEQVSDMQEPLDWLAKYCIINPDRLPLYEMIFEAVIADQQPRYVKPSPPSLKEVLAGVSERKEDPLAGDDGDQEGEEGGTKKKKKKKGKKKVKGEEKKEQQMSPLATVERSFLEPRVGLSLPEQQLQKLIYTLDVAHRRFQELSADLQALEVRYTKQLATKARELFPQVCAPDYTPKVTKKGKKSKNKVATPTVRLRSEDLTDDVIVGRLDEKMRATLRHEAEVRQTELEMERAREKLGELSERLQELATERLLTDAFCMNHFFTQQAANIRPREFRRQQSDLYNRLHPDPDLEFNMEDLEEALQHINGHLLTEKEFYFLFSVLNLPARTKINFKLFTVIAALSEKVSQLDPVVRKLINNTDLNALDIKMDKCRELFQFLEDEDIAPRGGATAERLAVELTAGGLTPEHTRFVLSKFNRERRGLVDFLDFVTYVPLFILIHSRIVSHPLKDDLDL